MSQISERPKPQRAMGRKEGGNTVAKAPNLMGSRAPKPLLPLLQVAATSLRHTSCDPDFLLRHPHPHTSRSPVFLFAIHYFVRSSVIKPCCFHHPPFVALLWHATGSYSRTLAPDAHPRLFRHRIPANGQGHEAFRYPDPDQQHIDISTLQIRIQSTFSEWLGTRLCRLLPSTDISLVASYVSLPIGANAANARAPRRRVGQ